MRRAYEDIDLQTNIALQQSLNAVQDVIDLSEAVGNPQQEDADLTAIAGLNTTSYGRSVLVVVDAAALRALAGLGALAVVTPSGTPDGSKFLRDDFSWQAASGGGGLSQAQILARQFVGC